MSRRVAFHSCREHMGCVFIVLAFPHSKTHTHCSRQQCAWPKTLLAKDFNAGNMWTAPLWLLCLHHPSLSPTPASFGVCFFKVESGPFQRDGLICSLLEVIGSFLKFLLESQNVTDSPDHHFPFTEHILYLGAH